MIFVCDLTNVCCVYIYGARMGTGVKDVVGLARGGIGDGRSSHCVQIDIMTAVLHVH